MKRIFLFGSVVLFSVANYAQKDSAVLKQATIALTAQYLQKSKHQTKTAFILAGSGTALAVIGFATFPRDYLIIGTNSSKTETNAGISTALVLAGAALIISSIPCFIAGGVNRHRAKVLMRTERVSLSPQLKLPGMQFSTGIAITI